MTPLTQILIHSSFILFLLVFHHFFSVNKIIKIKRSKFGYDNTHGLQLAIGDVYEAGVHVFIYDDTRFE
jgi:hypothetical protein